MVLSETPDIYINDSLSTVDDPLFHICWGRQSCSSCLAGDVGCSWCPIVGDTFDYVFDLPNVRGECPAPFKENFMVSPTDPVELIDAVIDVPDCAKFTAMLCSNLLTASLVFYLRT